MSSWPQTLLIRPDGSVVLPDLTDTLAVTATALGATPPQPADGLLGPPRWVAAGQVALPAPADLDGLPEPLLWRWHARGAALFRRGQRGRGEVAWTAVKRALAARLWGPTCRLCARRCAVDRRHGELGWCGLGTALASDPPQRWWGEEAELGRPGVALPLAGCGLRCAWCYRPDLWDARQRPPTDRTALAAALDAASDARHLHLAGGNPDEQLPAILDLLATLRVARPLVWNTHSHATPAVLALLEGVVDAYVADLKFGPGPCAARLAGSTDYWTHATAAIRALARQDALLIVRHVALPGHAACCLEPVARFLAEVPGVRARMLGQYEPWHRTVGEATLGRRLNAGELAALERWQDALGRQGRQR
ncbi:MAG: radical SAM protein [Fimbriimonadaceae bacterium]|nr:radical SAM protein [Fimbriimonadaceae bacterium]